MPQSLPSLSHDSRKAEELRHAAVAIADDLLASASLDGEGIPTWGRGWNVAYRYTQDAGIFNGRVGEALFFAALASEGLGERFSRAALKICYPLVRRLSKPASLRGAVLELGLGLTGVGSIIYALSRIAEYLGADEIRHALIRLVTLLDGRIIELDTRFEIFYGVSGLMLGTLAAHGIGVADALEVARRSAHHLLSSRSTDSLSGYRAWPTLQGNPCVGFAHGSTGIAHALLALHSRDAFPPAYEAAIEAFRFENSVYRPDINDWPDTASQVSDVLSSWCHGAPGVGMSRLSAVSHALADDEHLIASDIASALHRSLAFRPIDSHNLCCGILGRADFMLEAGQILENASLIDAATSLTLSSLAAYKTGTLILPRYDEVHMRPGLWQGITGVGYQFLRTTNPTKHTSVLRLS